MQLTIFDMMLEKNQQESYGKTSRASCPQKTTPSVPSWQDYVDVTPPSNRQGTDGATQVWFMGKSGQPLGALWTPNISEWLSEGGGSLCSLQEVLEDGVLPTRYYLSPKACRGILDRAEKRGKPLPPQLQQVLHSVAQGEHKNLTPTK